MIYQTNPMPASEATECILRELENGPRTLMVLTYTFPSWSRSTVFNALRRLHAARQIHIHAWSKDNPGQTRWSRIWALGAAVDAPEPTESVPASGQPTTKRTGLSPEAPVRTFRPKISAQDNPWAGLIR